jgi:hypothetical protein
MEVKFGFKKKIGSLSEGSVPVIFISIGGVGGGGWIKNCVFCQFVVIFNTSQNIRF